MSDLQTSILDLKAEFVCEALDLGQVHLQWTARHLQHGRLEEALGSFDKLVTAVRAAAVEMKTVRTILADKKLAAEANLEWRAQNGRAA